MPTRSNARSGLGTRQPNVTGLIDRHSDYVVDTCLTQVVVRLCLYEDLSSTGWYWHDFVPDNSRSRYLLHR